MAEYFANRYYAVRYFTSGYFGPGEDVISIDQFVGVIKCPYPTERTALEFAGPRATWGYAIGRQLHGVVTLRAAVPVAYRRQTAPDARQRQDTGIAVNRTTIRTADARVVSESPLCRSAGHPASLRGMSSTAKPRAA